MTWWTYPSISIPIRSCHDVHVAIIRKQWVVNSLLRLSSQTARACGSRGPQTLASRPRIRAPWPPPPPPPAVAAAPGCQTAAGGWTGRSSTGSFRAEGDAFGRRGWGCGRWREAAQLWPVCDGEAGRMAVLGAHCSMPVLAPCDGWASDREWANGLWRARASWRAAVRGILGLAVELLAGKQRRRRPARQRWSQRVGKVATISATGVVEAAWICAIQSRPVVIEEGRCSTSSSPSMQCGWPLAVVHYCLPGLASSGSVG
jgi:hypothetical protein